MSNLLSCNRLRFAYRGNPRPALDGVDFHVEPRQFVGIAGSAGAGKSTLVRCASGIVPKLFKGPFEGSVEVGGKPIANRRVAQLAGRIGTVFQDFESQLFSTNARLECAFGMENLGVDRSTMEKRIALFARVVGLEGLLDREPQSLSGGQKQRLALASVLCLMPDLLICDEPATDLDPVGRRDLHAVLDRLVNEGHAVVLVDHDTERLIRTDRVVVLGQGRVIAQGRPDQVLADPKFCRTNGMAPPPTYALAAALGLAERPATVDETVRLIERAGFVVRPNVSFAQPEGLTEAPVIEVEDLAFAYTAGVPALRGVSLQIRRGEFIALLGPNGSGKTTLVKHLNALLTADSGRVLYAGEPVDRIGPAAMGRKVGFVFQNPDHMLFAANVADEVMFGLRNLGIPEKERAHRMARALETVGLAGREKQDPFVMTKGDRQKLAVACVLACEPEILILDEPTTGLDAREQQAMMALLKRLNAAGHTVLIVTHALDVAAAHARRLVLMAEGRILADGPTREVFHRPDRLAAANLIAPAAVRLGARFCLPTLTVEELAGALQRRAT